MKAERAKTKPEFVPVIVTLESQEEVDALYALINHTMITCTLPILNGWQSKLEYFRSNNYEPLHSKLDTLLCGGD